MPLGRITINVASSAPVHTSSLPWMVARPNYSLMLALTQTNAPSAGSGHRSGLALASRMALSPRRIVADDCVSRQDEARVRHPLKPGPLR